MTQQPKSWKFSNGEKAPVAALILSLERPDLFQGYEKVFEKGVGCSFPVEQGPENKQTLTNSLTIAGYLLGPDYGMNQATKRNALYELLEAIAAYNAFKKADHLEAVLTQKVFPHCSVEKPSFLEFYLLERAICDNWDKVTGLSTTKVSGKVKELKSRFQTALHLLKRPRKLVEAMDSFKWRIVDFIAATLDIDEDIAFESLERPKNTSHGDIALPVPKLRLGGNPRELAEKIAKSFVPDDMITGIKPTGTYLNFSVNWNCIISSSIKSILSNANYGSNSSLAGKKIIVEFSSPNIAKPFHAGHLRSTIIGNFLKNLFKFCGAQVTAMNYLGDWGKQYGLLAVGYVKYGSEQELQNDPIKHLYQVYVRINQDASDDPSIHDQARDYFKRMEDGDREALALWKRFRDLSIDKYKEMYQRLNIEFDVYSGESMYEREMAESLADLNAKGLVTESDGALVADLNEYGLGVTVLQKSNGTTLYLTRDVAAAQGRKRDYNFDEMYYVVAAAQDLHLKQLFKILSLAGFEWSSTCKHINFGMVLGMSTRKGTVVFLEDIIDAAKEQMHSVMRQNEEKYRQIEDPERVSDVLGLTAVMVQDMSARRIKDYTFDLNRCTSFEGDTGPYLQYAHARTCSIERRCGVELPENLEEIKFSLLQEEVCQRVCDVLIQFPSIVNQILGNHEPCVLVSYLLNLSHQVMLAFQHLWVQNQEKDLAIARLALFKACRIVLCNGLKLLGLIPLERM